MKNRLGRRIKHIFMPRSLRLQLLSRSLMILSVLLVFIGIFQYVIMSHFLYQSTANNLHDEVAQASSHEWEQLLTGTQGAQGDEGHDGTEPQDSAFFSFNISSIAFINTRNQFTNVQGTAPELPATTYTKALSSGSISSKYQIVRTKDGSKQLIVLQPVFDSGTIGLIQVGTSVASLQRELEEQLLIFIGLAGLALIAGLLAFLPVLRRTLVPLSLMVKTTQRINAGNLDERLDTEQVQLEIELLSSSFNDMLDRLQDAFESERQAKEKMRQFVADASHELRTPITSIHGFLEVLLRGAAHRPNQLHKALRSMYGESDRIKKLVQDLLLLAQLDKEPSLTLTDGKLGRVVQDMEPQLRLLAGYRRVVFSIDTNVGLQFDTDRMKQVILNLFQNAVQHTDPDSGEIRVNLTRSEKTVLLSIKDNGPGIASDQLKKVFERFYRVDADRSRSHGGAGLGLAITKSIVEMHGGTIACSSDPGHGATFTVTLPILH